MHEDISVIIVNYNAGDVLRDCMQALLNSEITVQIYISDNGSKDDSLAQIESEFLENSQITIIRNNENLGFSAANNKALSLTRSKYLLFLNPDCIVGKSTLKDMWQLMENTPDAGIAGCLIKNSDGSEQRGCRRLTPTPLRILAHMARLYKFFPKAKKLRSYVLSHEPLPSEPVEMEAISGAFMFVRREALEQVGPLDPGYFLHCEDLDWCMRFNQSNWKILFHPNVIVTHVQGVCSKNIAIRVELYKHRGMLRYCRKFFRDQYSPVILLSLKIAVWLRFSLITMRLSARKIFSNAHE